MRPCPSCGLENADDAQFCFPGASTPVVHVLVSSGPPRLSYDNQQPITVIDPTTAHGPVTVSAGTGPSVDASWSPDGTHLITCRTDSW
jgi:hypothetical protein